MTKAEIRERMLTWRRALSPDAVAGASEAIAQRLWALPVFVNARAVLTYVASKDHEVATQGIIQTAIEEGRSVLVPRVTSGRQMEWVSLASLDDLRPSRFGVLEPPESMPAVEVLPTESVCLTPGIAFTREGYRIGYGGGYYDRFLSSYDGVSIGLAFDGQLVPFFLRADHDVPVQYLLTETKTTACCGRAQQERDRRKQKGVATWVCER